MPTGLSVAVVEGDASLARYLELALTDHGYAVRVFYTLGALEAALSQAPVEMIVLADRLPDGSGLDRIASLRERLGWQVPILVLSSKDDRLYLLQAVEAGADELLVKPVLTQELVLRARNALLRRGDITPTGGLLEFDPFHIDLDLREVTAHGQPVTLTRREFDLLAYFLQHQDQLITREQLSTAVWGTSEDARSRTIDAHISRVRRKLQEHALGQWQLRALRNEGYRLERTRPERPAGATKRARSA